MSQAHVGKILVRQKFYDCGRNSRQAGLAVVTVPHAAARPVCIESGTDVLLQTGEEQVGKVARGVAVCSCR